MIPNYTRRVFWSHDDGVWIAVIDALPGLSAHGDTPGAALTELEIALREEIDIYRQEGWTLPLERPAGAVDNPARRITGLYLLVIGVALLALVAVVMASRWGGW